MSKASKYIDNVLSVYQMHHFHLTGMICFIIIAIASSYALVYYWSIKILADKISGIFYIVFDIALFLLFYNMYTTSKKASKLVKSPGEAELDQMFQEVSPNTQKGDKQKKFPEGVG